MKIVIYVCIFFLLTPGILFTISKNKYISAFSHSIIFAFCCSLFAKNLEGLEEEVFTYLDPSCNVILKDSDTPAEGTPMFLIQHDKCINMNDYQE